MLSVLDLPVIDKQIFIENQFEYRFQASKIIHRIIFEISLYTQSVLENFFTCKKFSNFQKCAFTIRRFARCDKRPRALPFGNPQFFEKN